MDGRAAMCRLSARMSNVVRARVLTVPSGRLSRHGMGLDLDQRERFRVTVLAPQLPLPSQLPRRKWKGMQTQQQAGPVGCRAGAAKKTSSIPQQASGARPA